MGLAGRTQQGTVESIDVAKAKTICWVSDWNCQFGKVSRHPESACSTFGAVLGLYVVTSFLPHVTMVRRDRFYYPHFTRKGTEAQRS